MSDMIYCGAKDDCAGNNKGKSCPSGYSCKEGNCVEGCLDGQVLCDVKCITPETDMIYCGASDDCTGNNKGKTCPSGYSCKEGNCVEGCLDGQVLCDGKCITPETDMIYCGASDDCTGNNKGKTCPSGTSCQDGTCEAGCIEGQVLCDGKCITPGTDMIYCGASGDCSGQNKGTTCQSGTSCQGGTCETGCIDGQLLCDGKCITPGTDMIYCGASGDCSGKNKGTTCQSGTSCQGGTCETGCISGQVLCDGKCITPGTDMIYCGASGDCTGDNKGKTCPSGTSCQGGTCEAGCVSGQVLCDGKCITPGTDMNFCGASGDCTGQNKGKTCPSGTSCQGGTCEAGCVSGQVLCDGKCITPGTDMIYCGASGNCSGQNKGKTCPSGTSCQGGTCEAGCVSGQVLCDGKCITPGTDMIYCGASGNCSGRNKGTTCPSGTSCQGGTCEAGCIDGQLLCDGKCITPGTDMIYCGASGDCTGRNKGTTCPSGTSCQGGTCEAGCVSGQVLCDGKCITPGTDMSYCGASGDCTGNNKGSACKTGQTCTSGTCQCPQGEVLCGDKCIDPTTDMTYCGAKGTCDATEASSNNYKGQACVNGKVCVNGSCVQNSCADSLTLCSVEGENTCINTNESEEHCGGCNNKCSNYNPENAEVSSCTSGKCHYSCLSNFVNVGGGATATDIRCIDPTTDVTHCGANADSSGKDCSKQQNMSNAIEVACENSECIAKTCKTGFHVEGKQCVKDTDEACGSNLVDCTDKNLKCRTEQGICVKCLGDDDCKNVDGGVNGVCNFEFKCKFSQCQEGFYNENGECKSNDNENCGKKGETCTTEKINDDNATEVTCVGKTRCEVVKCEGGTIVSTSRDKCENCQANGDCGSESYFECQSSKCKVDKNYGNWKTSVWLTPKYCWRDEAGVSKCTEEAI